jgi:hypothetical protein
MNDDSFPPLAMALTSKTEYYKEKIVYFYYQLIRTDDIRKLHTEFADFIQVLKNDVVISKTEFQPFVYQIYKLTLHTRDLFDGKGEHQVAYMMVDVLYRHFKNIALACIYQFTHPCYKYSAFGSWRDIKYLCEYTDNEKLIDECVDIMNIALANDLIKLKGKKILRYQDGRPLISNVAKWIPRENKKFGWLFDRFVLDWNKKYHKYLILSPNNKNYEGALLKSKQQYRRLVASLNRILDTTEIKLCANQWNKISIENIPQQALIKYKPALCKYIFENPEKILESTFYSTSNMSRLECSLKTKKYYDQKFYPEGSFEPGRPHSAYIPPPQPLSKIIKTAFELLDRPHDIKIDILNNEWSTLSSIINKKHEYKNAIPMIDMSFLSIQTEAYYTAIGLAILLAERSTFGRRILVIDNQLCWINLEKDINLFDIVLKIRAETESQKGTARNINKVIQDLVKYIDESKLPNKTITELMIVYFHTQPLIEKQHEQIIGLFFEGGSKGSRNLPFPCPKMVYWNLSHTIGPLPGPINSKNCILLSGHSANLINTLSMIGENNYETVSEIIKHYLHPENID